MSYLILEFQGHEHPKMSQILALFAIDILPIYIVHRSTELDDMNTIVCQNYLSRYFYQFSKVIKLLEKKFLIFILVSGKYVIMSIYYYMYKV